MNLRHLHLAGTGDFCPPEQYFQAKLMESGNYTQVFLSHASLFPHVWSDKAMDERIAEEFSDSFDEAILLPRVVANVTSP